MNDFKSWVLQGGEEEVDFLPILSKKSGAFGAKKKIIKGY